jgi:DNA-binding HxlR family transcriptional regulator
MDNKDKQESKMCQSLFKMFGDRWSLRIIDALRDGELRFKEIQTALDINSATLSARLRKLESAKLLNRKEETIDKLSVSYKLTNLGKELLPIYDGMMKFGSKFIK